MFEQDNIAGTINGSFVLSGNGADLDTIRRDLDGTISFELIDGEWQGTDVWQQLRSARAQFRGETPPPVREPVRTEFTSVTASGDVVDGVFSNNDFLAQLPFMQLTGNGTVDLAAAMIDYSMQARVIEQPEFVDQASAAELKDFTAAVIPLKISGPLASPSIRPDIEALVRAEIDRAVEEKKEELTDQLMDRLFGGDESTQEEGTEQGTEEQEGDQPAEEEPSPEDLVKDALKNLFNR
jgi:AsmA protein